MITDSFSITPIQSIRMVQAYRPLKKVKMLEMLINAMSISGRTKLLCAKKIDWTTRRQLVIAARIFGKNSFASRYVAIRQSELNIRDAACDM